jgi:hypothetical protein
MRVPWQFVGGLAAILLVEIGFAQPTTTPAQAGETIDPVGWAEEQAFYKQSQDQLLEHIKGARNIEVAKGPQGVAPWPINWDVPQKFCHRVADAQFKKPQRLTLSEPQFAAYRDRAEKLHELWPVAFPNCSWLKEVELTIKFIKKEFSRRKAAEDYSLNRSRPHYYVEKNLLIPEFRKIDLRPFFGGARCNVSIWWQPENLKKTEMIVYDHIVCLDDRGCPLCFVPAAQQLTQSKMRRYAKGYGHCEKTQSVSASRDRGKPHRVDATAARTSANGLG